MLKKLAFIAATALLPHFAGASVIHNTFIHSNRSSFDYDVVIRGGLVTGNQCNPSVYVTTVPRHYPDPRDGTKFPIDGDMIVQKVGGNLQCIYESYRVSGASGEVAQSLYKITMGSTSYINAIPTTDNILINFN